MIMAAATFFKFLIAGLLLLWPGITFGVYSADKNGLGKRPPAHSGI
jgi:hypothetical protein